MTTSTAQEVVRSIGDIAATPPHPMVAGVRGMNVRVLNHDDGAEAGVLHVDAGHRLPQHRHPNVAHHAYLVEGLAEVFGRVLGPGSYWFVPPGDAHHLLALPPRGCDVFYVDIEQ